jgi:hypothetical protein
MLPLEPVPLIRMLDGLVDEVLIDRMNYTNKVKAIYRRFRLDKYLEDDYFNGIGNELKERLEEKDILVTMCF